jgi:hypothetical protein
MSTVGIVFVGEILKFRLLVLKHENYDDYSGTKRLRFTVVDLDKDKNYPLNLVCLLPARVNSMDQSSNTFVGIFGEKTVEVAKELMTNALKSENDDSIKTEIERRLKLLES